MRRTILAILITAIICVAGTSAFFWWNNAPNLNNAVALVNTTTHGQVTILNQFQAIGNLEGFVVQSTQNTAEQAIIYADNRGRYLVYGNIVSSSGQNISTQNYQTYIAPQSASLAFNYVGNTSYIQQGSNSAPHQAYVVFDPNCIFCHRLYAALQPEIQSGQLSVRWIPVAFLKPTSQGRVYAILSSKDPVSMLEQNETNFNEQTEDGGIPPLSSASAQVVQQLQNNMAFLTEAQINSTPAILYKTKDGIAKIVAGFQDSSKLGDLIQSFTQIF